MQHVQLDPSDIAAIEAHVTNNVDLSAAPDFAQTDEDKRAAATMYYTMLATMHKAKHGSVGNLATYPKMTAMPDSFKDRIKDANPSTYSDVKILRRLKEYFHIEEDEARKLSGGNLRELYFDVCCKLADDLESDAEDEDDYELPLHKRIELSASRDADLSARRQEFEAAAIPAKDGTVLSFDDAMKAMEGLGDVFNDDE